MIVRSVRIMFNASPDESSSGSSPESVDYRALYVFESTMCTALLIDVQESSSPSSSLRFAKVLKGTLRVRRHSSQGNGRKSLDS